MAKCCRTGKSNTGLPKGCHSAIDIMRDINFVDLADGGGVKNQIDLTVTLDDAYFLARTNDTDKSKRWFPVMGIDNVGGERADNEYKTYPSGKRVKLRDGVRNVTFVIPSADVYYFKKLKALECAKNQGFFGYDLSENIHGSDAEAGFLSPIPIEDDTMQVKLMPPTNEDEPHIMISFDIATRFKDEDMAYIYSADLASDVDTLADYDGLLDLYGGTATGISTTGFTMPITSKFVGTSGDPVEDIPQASFEVWNRTTLALVSGLAVAESPEGTYAFSFDAQTASDVVEPRIVSSVNGFDDTNLRSVGVTL